MGLNLGPWYPKTDLAFGMAMVIKCPKDPGWVNHGSKFSISFQFRAWVHCVDPELKPVLGSTCNFNLGFAIIWAQYKFDPFYSLSGFKLGPGLDSYCLLNLPFGPKANPRRRPKRETEANQPKLSRPRNGPLTALGIRCSHRLHFSN